MKKKENEKEDVGDSDDNEEEGMFTLKRYAIKYEPPTFLVEYENDLTEKKYVRKIKFKAQGKSPEELTKKILKENSDIMASSKVDREQILDLVKEIFNRSRLKTKTVDASKDSQGNSSILLFKPPSKLSNEELIKGDLNSVSDDVNNKAKELMNVDFEKNRIAPDSQDFVYDKRIDFVAQESNEWDED